MEVTQEKINTRAFEENHKKTGIVDAASHNRGIRNGILLGLVVALYSLFIQIIAPSESAAYFKPVKYLFMLGAFYYTLKNYKERLPKGEIFKRGSVLGIYMSIATALTVFALMSLFQVLFPSIEFSQYTQDIDSDSKAVIFDWMLLVETFVFGIIINFIILQGLKDTNRTK